MTVGKRIVRTIYVEFVISSWAKVKVGDVIYYGDPKTGRRGLRSVLRGRSGYSASPGSQAKIQASRSRHSPLTSVANMSNVLICLRCEMWFLIRQWEDVKPGDQIYVFDARKSNSAMGPYVVTNSDGWAEDREGMSYNLSHLMPLMLSPRS